MILSLIAAAAMFAPQDAAAITLTRTNKLGEIQGYKVLSHLLVEQRDLGQEAFLPYTVDLNYDFSVEVKKEKGDGVVEALYKRPAITQIDGETADRVARTSVEKINWILKMDLSPINKLLAIEDLTPKDPKKDPKKTGAKDGDGNLKVMSLIAALKPAQGDIVSQFIGELHRLALFIGGIDSSMDFQPKLPIFEVKKGETWKETVSYSPQKLKSKSGKTVMQRLDYIYTYDGIVESKGLKVHRITATLDMNADLAQFIKDAVGNQEFSESGLKELLFVLKAKIDYDLDLNTRRTLRAEGKSEGGFKIVVSQFQEPVVEQKLKGRTTMTMTK